MKKNRFAALVLAVPLAVVALAGCSGGETWASYESNYLKSCSASASSSGADSSVIDSYCKCTFDAIKDKYTVDEFKELDKLAGTDQSAAVEKLSGVIQACVAELK